MGQNDIELMTSQVYLVETSDVVDTSKPKRAIIRIPIISEGPNSKNLYWTKETMSKIAEKFRGVPFRYDLNGQNEGSHTREHLSSPFYDVGWTYSDERGANFDPSTNTIWVQGEVTNPEVIEKLSRQTSEGRREINFASMGAMIKPEDTQCSVCNRKPFGVCEHERGKTYGGKVCAMVPTDIAKALHVALTNDPADKNAEIAEAIFQDMNEIADNTALDSPVPVAPNLPGPSDSNDLKSLMRTILIEAINKKKKPMEEPKEDIEMKKDEKDEKDKKSVVEGKDDAEDDKEKIIEKADDMPKEDSKEESKEDPKEEKKEEPEESDEEKKKKKDKEHEKDIKETADDVEFKISGVAQEKPTIEFQDNSIPRQAPASIVETASNDYASKYKHKLLMEVADDYFRFNKAKSKEEAYRILQEKSIEQLELLQDAYDGIVVDDTQKVMPTFQDDNHIVNNTFANDVPEFGGMEQEVDPFVEFQDMSPDERAKHFGSYGSFDLCFNPHNAGKYRK